MSAAGRKDAAVRGPAAVVSEASPPPLPAPLTVRPGVPASEGPPLTGTPTPVRPGRDTGPDLPPDRDGELPTTYVGKGAEPGGGVPAADLTDHRSRASQSFWTLVVGVPALFSVLRLGVEAGGELQTTLLLVANVNPVNLAGALVTTAARLVSAGLVAIFAIGGTLAVSAEAAPTHRIGRRPPLFARWRRMTPHWAVLACFGIALATWPILYLPLLLPAFAAAFQLSPAAVEDRRVPRALGLLTLLAGYGVLMAPTLGAGWTQREYFAVLVIAAPPLLALLVAGPIPAAVARPVALTTQLAVLVTLCWAALPVITTPVLPLTVTTVRTGGTAAPGEPDDGTGPERGTSPGPGVVPDGGTEPEGRTGTDGGTTPGGGTGPGSDGGTEDIRGHVITVDDVHAVILQERGGVRYVPVERIEAQVLCPTEGELPRYRLRVWGFHVEDSLLEGLGRRVRPVNRVDAACRIPPATN